jgi:hypothetical protein
VSLHGWEYQSLHNSQGNYPFRKRRDISLLPQVANLTTPKASLSIIAFTLLVSRLFDVVSPKKASAPKRDFTCRRTRPNTVTQQRRTVPWIQCMGCITRAVLQYASSRNWMFQFCADQGFSSPASPFIHIALVLDTIRYKYPDRRQYYYINAAENNQKSARGLPCERGSNADLMQQISGHPSFVDTKKGNSLDGCRPTATRLSIRTAYRAAQAPPDGSDSTK